jgi:hypothetical protein
LAQSSVQQSYIGYKKSTVAMYALQDYIGEDSVGVALGRIVEKYGYRLDTFALVSNLIDEFYKVTPDSLVYLVNDLFLEITLYENKIIGSSYNVTDNNQYVTTLEFETKKYYADSVGNQTQALLNDYIYVALFDEDENPIYYKKHLFTKDKTKIDIITDRIPYKAGIDPYLVLIDREIDDNICEVENKIVVN